MFSGIPPMGITQNERFLSCDAVLLGVRYGRKQCHLLTALRFRHVCHGELGEMIPVQRVNRDSMPNSANMKY
jgi:hypothetical protein